MSATVGIEHVSELVDGGSRRLSDLAIELRVAADRIEDAIQPEGVDHSELDRAAVELRSSSERAIVAAAAVSEVASLYSTAFRLNSHAATPPAMGKR
jgi:hypothetical protein